MYKTIEAIYEDGKIKPLDNEIPVKKARVLLIIMDDKDKIDNEKGIDASELIKYKGILKNFPQDSVQFQRELRDEW